MTLGGIDFAKVLATAEAVSGQLERKGVPHAIVGGLAVAAHGYRRFTQDVDLLVPSDRDDVVRHALRGEARLLTMRGLVGRAYKKGGVDVDVMRPTGATAAALDLA